MAASQLPFQRAGRNPGLPLPDKQTDRKLDNLKPRIAGVQMVTHLEPQTPPFVEPLINTSAKVHQRKCSSLTQDERDATSDKRFVSTAGLKLIDRTCCEQKQSFSEIGGRANVANICADAETIGPDNILACPNVEQGGTAVACSTESPEHGNRFAGDPLPPPGLSRVSRTALPA